MYKTILVHVDQTTRSVQRAVTAARLARLYDAHLVGVAMTGLQSYLLPVGAYESGFGALGLPVTQLRDEAERSLSQFEAAARAAGVTSVECRCVDDDPGIGIAMQSRYGDLVVISQTEPTEFMPRLRSDFPDYVVLNAPRPVLVLPPGRSADTLGERVTVAWNGSPQASRAIVSAIALLQRAAQVDLVVFDADIEGDLHGEEPGADMALYLARHGVRVEVSSLVADLPEGQSLLAFAQQKQSDLIVMGAFGHTRFREIMLGGMTGDLLATSTMALWMAH